MICLQVILNREKLATAGLSGFGVVANHITWVRRRAEASDRLWLELSGLDSNIIPGEHVHWAFKELRAGDEVVVRIIEDAEVNAPRQETSEQAKIDRARMIRLELKSIERRRRQLERALRKLERPRSRAASENRSRKRSRTRRRRKA